MALFTSMVAYFSPPSAQTLHLYLEMEAGKRLREPLVRTILSACPPPASSSEDGGREAEKGLQGWGVSLVGAHMAALVCRRQAG